MRGFAVEETTGASCRRDDLVQRRNIDDADYRLLVDLKRDQHAVKRNAVNESKRAADGFADPAGAGPSFFPPFLFAKDPIVGKPSRVLATKESFGFARSRNVF